MGIEITRISSKGQIVLPLEIRKNIEIGTVFNVVKKDDIIVLKKVEGLSEEELKEMEELSKIWKDYDDGKFKSYSQDEFFAKMKEW